MNLIIHFNIRLIPENIITAQLEFVSQFVELLGNTFSSLFNPCKLYLEIFVFLFNYFYDIIFCKYFNSIFKLFYDKTTEYLCLMPRKKKCKSLIDLYFHGLKCFSIFDIRTDECSLVR